MNSTTSDFEAIPVPVDHDARNLAIVYGSLGTLIAFASLIFAILSWMRTRHQRLAARQPSIDVELGVNPSQNTPRMLQELQTTESVSHKYAYTNKRNNPRSKLTSHSDHHEMSSALPDVDITQPQPPFELGGATMPPRADASRQTAETTNTRNIPCSASVTPRTT